MPFHYFFEDISFNLTRPLEQSHWLLEVLDSYSNKTPGDINYIFCSDEYLLKINQEHLAHDYYTDIITFDQSEDDQEIAADIFISIDRVNENAAINKVSFQDELDRVMVHGLLHLVGFQDKTKAQQQVMREKEEACLSLRKV